MKYSLAPQIIANANLFDVDAGAFVGDRHILIREGRVAEVSEAPIKSSSAELIDVFGATVMPGLIDAHVHVNAYTANLAELPGQSPAYVTARAASILRGMLDRGFTTVRDVGGAEFGIARAVAEGHIVGPRIVYGGKALSASAGHGDMRSIGQDHYDRSYFNLGISRICNGVAEVRAAARDEIRRGASHIKIMANGGVSSPTDRIDSDQFSEEEIAAATDEAEMAGLYVVAHAYTARSITRAVRNGVRSIEHGNLADEAAISLMKAKGAYLVPTLATYHALFEEGVKGGLPAELAGKIDKVLHSGIRAVEYAHRQNVPMAYGTDLLGDMHSRQLSEFELRAEAIPIVDVIRSATVTAAKLLRMENEIGQIQVGYRADLIAFQGDPTRNAQVLSGLDKSLSLVMQNGKIHRSAAR